MAAVARSSSVQWNITAVRDPDALDRYREGLADWYGASGFDEARLPRFFTDNVVCQFGEFVVGRGRSIGQTLTRGVHEIRRSGWDGVLLLLDFGGIEGDIDGVRVSGRPGTVHVRHLGRPSAARTAVVDAVTIMVPRAVAPAWLLEPRLHGACIDDGPAIGRVLINHMTALSAAAPMMSPGEGIVSVEAVLILAEKAFRDSGRLSPVQTRAVYAGIRASTTALIDRRLTEPALGIADLTAALGVSRATLFRAFADRGGIGSYINRQRLHRARSVLLGRAGRSPSVAEIAHAHGFASESHFSRLFKAAYGEAPGAVRADRATPGRQQADDIRYDLVFDWMKAGSD